MKKILKTKIGLTIGMGLLTVVPISYSTVNISKRKIIANKNLKGNKISVAKNMAPASNNINFDISNKWIDSPTSAIDNGAKGSILEDSSGNLWAMGNVDALQERPNGSQTWEIATGSNITNGYDGQIFEDSNNNLWVVAPQNMLKEKLSGSTTWTSVTSNITSGFGGVIYETDTGTIWSMAGSALQYKGVNATSWTNAHSSSNIANGSEGTIFKDSSGTLWSMGKTVALQKKLSGQSTWTAPSDTQITNGWGGTIIQDTSGILWAMGKGSKLRKKSPGSALGSSWSQDASSNIVDGEYGSIFQDMDGNIWSMGNGTKLQVRKSGATSWVLADSTSNITNGYEGTIFQDSEGNLWAMGNGTSMQMKKRNSDIWVTDSYSGITDGGRSTMYQDSEGNLWSMARGSKLKEKKRNNHLNDVQITKTKDVSYIGAQDAEISLSNFGQISIGATIEYKLSTASTWIAISQNKITGLNPGTYQFRVVLESGYSWAVDNTTHLLSDVTIADTTIIGIDQSTITSVSPMISQQVSHIGANNGQIQITDFNLLPAGAKAEYKLSSSSTWIPITIAEIDNLAPGVYNFQIALESNHIWTTGGNLAHHLADMTLDFPTSIGIDQSTIALVSPMINQEISHIGAADGQIQITDFNLLSVGTKVEYKLSSSSTWIPITISEIDNLAPGVYNFQIALESNYVWTTGGNLGHHLADITMPASTLTGVDKNLVISVSSWIHQQISYQGANDGIINIDGFNQIPIGTRMEYKLSTDSIWNPVATTTIDNLAPGIYNFQIVLENNHVWTSGGNLAFQLDDVDLNASPNTGVNESLLTSVDLRITKNITYKGADNGEITVINFDQIPVGAKLEYKVLDGSNSEWTIVTKDKITGLSDGIYVFQVSLHDQIVWIGGLNGSFEMNNLEMFASTKIGIKPTKIASIRTIVESPISFKGAHDGKVLIDYFDQIPYGATMEYKLANDSSWTAIDSSEVTGLVAGTYEFQVVLSRQNVWTTNGTNIQKLEDLTIKDSSVIHNIPGAVSNNYFLKIGLPILGFIIIITTIVSVILFRKNKIKLKK